MNKKNIVIGPPVTGQWAIMNPPGHPKLGYDFLAVDDRKNPYKRGYFLRHLLSPISIANTLAWSQPVFAPLDSVVAEIHDGSPAPQLGLSVGRTVGEGPDDGSK